MKIINIDELEQQIINYCIKNSFFSLEDLKIDNLFTISLEGKYQFKSFVLEIERSNRKIILRDSSWENLYYKIKKFFND